MGQTGGLFVFADHVHHLPFAALCAGLLLLGRSLTLVRMLAQHKAQEQAPSDQRRKIPYTKRLILRLFNELHFSLF